ncbi:hypothetical protein GCM10027063_40460 [Promicromonospora xylanilytica]
MTEPITDTPEVEEVVTPETETPVVEEGKQETDGDTFPRSYVEELRSESARYRERSRDMGQRLHTALVAATGRLADPADLPFDEAHIDDPEALAASIESLLASKPHLANRTPKGDVGQGVRPETQKVSLGSLLRNNL